MLTALAVAPTSTSTNKARRMVQYEVARIALPPMPAALTIAGPIGDATHFGDSNNFAVDGRDACGGQNRPAVGTVQDVGNGTESAIQVASDSQNVIINNLKRPNNYTGVDACKPDVQNVQNLANQNYQTPDGLNALVHDVQNAATQTISMLNPPASIDFGSPSNPKITVIDGNYTLPKDASQGAGVLLVTGVLTIAGDTNWNGLLLVVGTGQLIVNGTPQINGAVLVANIGKTSGCASGNHMIDCYANNPTDANLNIDPITKKPVLGPPDFHWNGGGIGGVTYDSCKIQAARQAANYTVIARREITY